MRELAPQSPDGSYVRWAGEEEMHMPQEGHTAVGWWCRTLTNCRLRVAVSALLCFASHTRPNYGFRGWIGRGMFPQEAGRYHIYVGNTCPWCHRAVLAVVLRGLAPGITFSYMDDSKCLLQAALLLGRWVERHGRARARERGVCTVPDSFSDRVEEIDNPM